MVKFAPPRRLVHSLPFTAIQEEARVAALGGRFLAWSDCFHYLIPVVALDDVLRENVRPSPFVIYSCWYESWSHELSRINIAPIEGPFAWEARAKEISFQLDRQDSDAKARP